MYSYLLFLLILLPCLAFSAWASARVNSTFSAFDKVPNASCMTGYDAATRLMAKRGLAGSISVNRVNGKLTDHYNPAKKQVNLSVATYGSASVAAVAVAAHEVGHVMQKREGYVPYKIRNVLVPITKIGSRLALPVIIVGLILDLLALVAQPIGEYVVYVGIALYGLSTLFMLTTLPVEFNASKRARLMLVEDGILTPEEAHGAKKVLSAAALTYVASLLISLVYFLRLLILLISIVGRRK